MSKHSEGAKSLKGLKAKYGATVRKRYTRILATLKQKRRCPACGALRIYRESSGIWKCKSCGLTKASDSYDFKAASGP